VASHRVNYLREIVYQTRRRARIVHNLHDETRFTLWLATLPEPLASVLCADWRRPSPEDFWEDRRDQRNARALWFDLEKLL